MEPQSSQKPNPIQDLIDKTPVTERLSVFSQVLADHLKNCDLINVKGVADRFDHMVPALSRQNLPIAKITINPPGERMVSSCLDIATLEIEGQSVLPQTKEVVLYISPEELQRVEITLIDETFFSCLAKVDIDGEWQTNVVVKPSFATVEGALALLRREGWQCKPPIGLTEKQGLDKAIWPGFEMEPEGKDPSTESS